MKKSLVSMLSALFGVVLGAGVTGKIQEEALKKCKDMSEKHLALFLMMNRWVEVRQEGKRLVTYFENNGYKRIAVYGMSYAGETLLEELRGTEIQVAYGIDKNASSICADIEVVSMEDSLEDVDVVVVTAIAFFDEIERELSDKLECTIISLEDILYEI